MKLVLNLVLTALVLVSLRVGLPEVAERGRQLASGANTAAIAVGDMIFPPIVSPTALLFALVLSVFKPWGRIRKRRP